MIISKVICIELNNFISKYNISKLNIKVIKRNYLTKRRITLKSCLIYSRISCAFNTPTSKGLA